MYYVNLDCKVTIQYVFNTFETDSIEGTFLIKVFYYLSFGYYLCKSIFIN